MTTRSTGDHLIQALGAAGVDTIFGVPGGQTLDLYRASTGSPVRHVLMRDERSAACAADAYARFKGVVGVCDATVGPGATNLISGLAEAMSSSVPVVAIVADIRRRFEHLRRGAVASQAFDQRALLEPVTKWMARVSTAESLGDVVEHALRVATSGRPGPVAIEIPEDVFEATEVDAPRPSTSGLSGAYPRHRPSLSASFAEQVAAMLAQAERPLILAGGGATLSGAGAAINELARRTGIPVATTINGKGIIDERSAQSVGVVGVFGCFRGNHAFSNADLVLVLGSKFDQLTSHSWRVPAAHQQVVHIDIDGEELGRTTAATLSAVADVREAAVMIIAALAAGTTARENWMEDVVEPVLPFEDANGLMNARDVVLALSEALRPGDVVVSDASLSSGWCSRYVKIPTPSPSFAAPRGLAGIGWAGGAAIGARCAVPSSNAVVMVAGDGAWTYSCPEVETAVRLGMPIVFLILNNSSFGWVRHSEARRGLPDHSTLGGIDFAGVATAMGARAAVVHSPDGLQAAFSEALASPVPFLIDARTSPDCSPAFALRDLRQSVQ